MSKLPAVGAILVIAVLAAAAPAAQGRRVLVAVERDAHSPAGGVRSGTLPDGSPTYLVKVAARIRARAAYARGMVRRPHVIAAQVDRIVCAAPGPAVADGLHRQRPHRRSRSIAEPDECRRWPTSARPTKPIAILDTGVDPNVAGAGRTRPARPRRRWRLPGARPGRTRHRGRVGRSRRAGRRCRAISPTSPVFSVRIFNSTGDSSSDIVVQAITAAVQNGAGVINISAAGAIADAIDARQSGPHHGRSLRRSTPASSSSRPSGNEGKTQADAPGRVPARAHRGLRQRRRSGATSSRTAARGSTSLAPGIRHRRSRHRTSARPGYAQVKGTSFASPARWRRSRDGAGRQARPQGRSSSSTSSATRAATSA